MNFYLSTDMENILLIISSALLAGWGIAHIIPTSNIVKDFGDISGDNRNIIRMEWIIEGATLIFLGLLVLVVSLIDRNHVVSRTVYFSSIRVRVLLAYPCCYSTVLA